MSATQAAAEETAGPSRAPRARLAPAPLLAAAAALAAAGLAVQPAPAQIASGYSGRSSTRVMDDGEAWRTLAAFGSCYASRNTAGAAALIATEPGSREEAETYRRLFRRETQGCLGGETELRMPVSMVRGAIAEGYYERGVALPENLAQSVPEAGAVRTLSEAARCYVAGHRAEADALVRGTRPGSRQEHEALVAMAPDFFRCVPEAARGRSFDPTLIRYRLVEALLRLPAAAMAAASRE